MIKRLLAHRARSCNQVRILIHKTFHRRIAHLGLLAHCQHCTTKIETTAKTLFLFVLCLHQSRNRLQNLARLVVNSASATKFARIVVNNLKVVLAQLQPARPYQPFNIFGVMHNLYWQVIFLCKRLVAYRTRCHKQFCLRLDYHTLILQTQVLCLFQKSLLQQRTTTANSSVLVHIPVFLVNRLKNLHHRFGNARSKMRHTATKIQNSSHRIECLNVIGISIVTRSIKGTLLCTHLTANCHKV